MPVPNGMNTRIGWFFPSTKASSAAHLAPPTMKPPLNSVRVSLQARSAQLDLPSAISYRLSSLVPMALVIPLLSSSRVGPANNAVSASRTYGDFLLSRA